MDLTLTEDQELIRSTAREFLSAAEPSGELWTAEPSGKLWTAEPSGKLWTRMVELGWAGLPFPEEYGGLGAGFLELCLVLEEIGRARVPSPLAATVACCGMPVMRYGTVAERAAWLPAITGGRLLTHVEGIAAQAGTLLGTAMFVPHADIADTLLVIAHADRPLAVLIDGATPGISREPLAVVGDESYRVSFDHVPIPEGSVLASGSEIAAAIVAYGAAATCAEMVGGAQAVLDMTVDYATRREQFGRPIGAFQAVQHHCADMAVEVLGARLLAYEAIWRLAAGLDAATEVALAKSWVSEVYQRVCATAHQVHGAIGFTAEHGLHHYTRHAMACALAFGDADHHIGTIVRHLGMGD
ncbi:acyl-CoA dehydrogenase family protein [Nocardia otitidiscaviarum]|uniref:acyl-CoA dehydrogenase family protein n=1 Tax=Nocardia otitidiscaviarum TaxID=1823 RepID=UPI002457A92F|nr:acyl-CoA dehydrogenase family protein [Nocardia otitidiscaviarum]